ncbi:MAG: HemK2/MTQ2 family protein methyltransferase [Candidatus Heimdallarchaeota archaeon]
MRKVIDGLTLTIPKDVYDPAEDSFLLVENVVIPDNSRVLEIGPGSGYVSLFLAKKYSQAEYFCIDINPIATITTKKNAQVNKLSLHVICANLFSTLKISSDFDVILFNSPYLPVSEEGLLSKAWSGGTGGMDIVSKYLESLDNYLSKDSSSYLVVSSKTDLKQLNNTITKSNLSWKEIDSLKEGGEKIILYKITRKLI